MKTLTVTILLLCCHRCLGTFVVDLNELSNEDKDTFLSFGQEIEITNPLTFCLRFNIRSALETNYIFSSTDEQLALIMRFSVSQGLVLLNSVGLFFEIPKDNAVLPFRWHHICFTSNEDYYVIVLDGQQWYHANHTKGSFEKKTVTRFDLGSTSEYWIYSDGINFRGLLSELNIWSKSLSVIQVAKITRNCGKVDPLPDLLNWSELPSSMIIGSKYDENIENICSNTNTTSLIYKTMPDRHHQDNAIHVCKILNGELVSPNSLNEFQTWNGKLSRMKYRNVNNNFPPLSVVLVSENACTYFAAPIRRSSNGSWINQNDDKIVDMAHLWNSHSPYGEDLNKCTGFFAKDCKYYVTHCKSKACFICAWKDTPVFNLRGLCPTTKIDEQYVLLPEKIFGGNVFFFGIRKNNILFIQETSSWLIVKNGVKEIFKPGGISTDSLNVVGTFKPDQSNVHHLPVGTHFWNLTENCNKVLQLKLTRV